MASDSAATATGGGKTPITIKKYANRRLYNTATSSYVTLEALAAMVKDGEDFVVFDAKSGEDITRSVLTQIIFEEEAKGEYLLPINFLRQLIRFYGDSMQTFVPGYLEMSLSSLTAQQEQFREQVTRSFGDNAGFAAMDALARQNREWFENAMRMFSPFSGANPFAPRERSTASKPAPTENAAAGGVADIESLRAEMERMRATLDALSRK